MRISNTDRELQGKKGDTDLHHSINRSLNRVVFVDTIEQKKATRNRTLRLTETEVTNSRKNLDRLFEKVPASRLDDTIIHQNLFDALPHLPGQFIDLLFIDPPYNLSRNYNGLNFYKRNTNDYKEWFISWFDKLLPALKPNASVYVCTDWKHSSLIHDILESRLFIRNRITWEREKGRGSQTNWKNNMEDIWYASASNDPVFNVDSIKNVRPVIAPYRNSDGSPKDWDVTQDGNFRVTYPSNLWTDLTIPFWSMAENTDHPTQKPEKLLAKIILASSNPGDLIFDPFGGSGTTAVVAKKLDRKFCSIEQDLTYCALTRARLKQAESNTEIQGYNGRYFMDRNTRQIKNHAK